MRPLGKGGRLATLAEDPSNDAANVSGAQRDEDEGWEAVEIDSAMTETLLSQPDGQAFLAMVEKQA